MKEKLWNANYIKVMTTNFLLYFAFYLLTSIRAVGSTASVPGTSSVLTLTP
jgi:hypothetical protein